MRAAIAIRDAVLDLAETDDGQRLSVRIAVNTGEALVKPYLSPDEGERIVADFVNVAARLEAAAPTNGILVGQSTYLRTTRAIEFEAFDPLEVKGKAEPVLAWKAVAARARIGADLRERNRSPLVGRLDEVQMLCDAFARARRERSAQLVTLIGPPGIGKSRLVLELSAVVEDDPELVAWRRGACLPYGDGVTYLPLAEMVKAQAGILETDDVDEVDRKLRREVEDLIADEEEARWVSAHLRTLLGLSAPEDARGDRGEDFAAWRRFFEALGDPTPAVLVFEDLHWADEGLLDFVDYLVDWASGVSLLVVCTARPELLARRADWGGGKGNATTITLSPLSDAETEELLGGLLERAVLPAELKTSLLAQAGGNPLYAEEFVRMLAERGEPDGEIPVPDTVQGIIAARLDTLDSEEKAVLQDAAVVGRVFWVGAVAQVGRRAASAVDERLRSLERKQFVRRQRRSTFEGEAEYAFRHLLVRDVAYERIPRERRAEKHELAAAWVETLARPEEHSETFAHHYAQALQLARAVGRDTSAVEERTRVAFVEAGDRAASLKNHVTAVRFYESALELWPREGPGWAELRFKLGKELFWSRESGADVLAEAGALLREAGDVERAAEAEVMVGRLAWRGGRRDESLARYRDALALLEGSPPSASKVFVLLVIAKSLLITAESEAAITVGREARQMAGELGRPDLVADATVIIADARVETGDLAGLEEFEAGIASALEAGSFDAISGLINLADTYMDLGDLARAAELREQAQRTAERFGEARSLTWLQAERAGALYWSGRFDDALALADEFVARSERGPRHYQEIYCRVTRGRIRLARGDLAGALDDAEKADAFAREAKDPQAVYPSLAFRARALAAAGRGSEATGPALELVELLRGSTKAPVAFVWALDLSVALAETGRGAAFAEATARVRKPTPWLEAAAAIARDEPVAAAAIYERIGARAGEAVARSRAARLLAEAGDEAAAALESERAAAFYRAVGAEAAAAEAERPLAAPA